MKVAGGLLVDRYPLHGNFLIPDVLTVIPLLSEMDIESKLTDLLDQMRQIGVRMGTLEKRMDVVESEKQHEKCSAFPGRSSRVAFPSLRVESGMASVENSRPWQSDLF